MPFPLIGAIASIGSAYLGYKASQNAADAQVKAANKASQVQRQNFLDTQETLAPQIEAGNTARNYQLGLLNIPGGVSRDQAMESFQTSPGYEFRQQQGIDAIGQSAAAGGHLYSGKSMKDLTRFGQDYASNEFGAHYNRLAGVSGSGQAATGQQVGAGQATANNLSQIGLGAGQARASGYINQANAVSGGMQNLSDLYAYYNPPGQSFGRGSGVSPLNYAAYQSGRGGLY